MKIRFRIEGNPDYQKRYEAAIRELMPVFSGDKFFRISAGVGFASYLAESPSAGDFYELGLRTATLIHFTDSENTDT